MTTYLPAILSVALLYGALGLALNLNWGRTGIINFGVVAFFAVGAYTSALLDTVYGVNIWISSLAGCALAGLAAIPMGWITLRLKADFLAIVTIGFAESLRIFVQGVDWTGGPSGVIGISRPWSGSSPTVFNVAWLVIFCVSALITYVIVNSITRSRLGNLLRAIKSDETAVAMLGNNVVGAKTLSLVISAVLTGGIGALYAHYIGYISPDQFTAMVTFDVWAGIIIGGSSDFGALVGSMLLVGILESTRFVDWSTTDWISVGAVANIRMMIVGLVIVLFLIFRAQGLFPHRGAKRNQRLGSEPASGVPGGPADV